MMIEQRIDIWINGNALIIKMIKVTHTNAKQLVIPSLLILLVNIISSLLGILFNVQV